MNELGEIETPILVTSILSVPGVADALVDYMLALPGNDDVESIDPLVGETNDEYLNDIRGRHIAREDVFRRHQERPERTRGAGSFPFWPSIGFVDALEERRAEDRCYLLSVVISDGVWSIGNRSPAEGNSSESRAIVFRQIANCHAADGSGHTAAASKMKVTDLRSKHVRQMSDEELYTATAQGKGHESYPHAFLYTGLTEQQIHDLIKYIRTFGNNRK